MPSRGHLGEGNSVRKTVGKVWWHREGTGFSQCQQSAWSRHSLVYYLSRIGEGRGGKERRSHRLLNNLDSSAYSALRERLLWKGACGNSFRVNAVPSTSPHSGETINKLSQAGLA